MKNSIIFFCAVCSLSMGGAAQAVAPTVLYDNFNASQINPAKWVGGKWSADKANLENLRYITMSNLKLGNRLRLYARGSGANQSNSGKNFGSNPLNFHNPEIITAIKASVWANSATITSCHDNPYVGTVRARVGGTFFNTGASATPGDNTNDVLAQIRLQRAADSSDSANVVRVRYSVFLCEDKNCFTGSDLGRGEIGSPVNPGQKVTLSVEWDKANKRFVFQRDALPAVIVPYTVSDASAPGGSFKQLQTSYYVANCTSATPPTAAIDAYFDDIYTNSLPTSAAMKAVMEESDPRLFLYTGASGDPDGR